MTTLLIAAHGQLGSELLAPLRALGTVVATCRSGAPPGEPALRGGVDLAAPDSLRRVVREVRPGVIVNAGAYTAVDAAESDVAAAWAANEAGPAVLAEEAARIGAALVHYSTDYVFNGNADRPWREDDPIDPINVYGRTKAAGEAAIRASGAHLIVRTSWLYGRHGRNFIKTMLRLAAQKRAISVVDDQLGTPTSAPFVARATGQILAQAAGDPGWFADQGGTLHVACAGQTSWHGFARQIFETAAELGLSLPEVPLQAVASAEFPTPARRPRYSSLDTTRLAEQYGIAPPPWQQELRNHLGSVYADCFPQPKSDVNAPS